MRGNQTHKVLFNDDLVLQKSTGRSKQLIKERNKALIDRYYFIASKTNWRYELVVKKLSSEFYLSEAMVIKIVKSNLGIIIELKKEKPTPNQLKKQHPHFDWSLASVA